jgi:hypothetical protein
MAEAMQGIMALSGAPEMGAQGAPQLDVDPAAMAAFEEVRSQINPEEFGTELLKAGEQIDPMELKSLRDTLKAANLPPQIIDAIGQMVDAVLAEPDKYQELRAGFLAEGVPEELLPAEFDGGFFAALNLALDQINTSFPKENPMQGGIASMPMGASMPVVEPQAFAMGGLASLRPIPAGLAQMGRNGDTMLAHITPSEARMLRRNGGSGTTNPRTGLPEFFLGKVFKAVGNAFKSVGKAVVKGVKAVASGVKKFAKSTIGRVVIGVALAYFLGPAAASFLGVSSAAGVAAVSGFVGGFGSTMLAGKGIKEALKFGAIGGVTAGIGAGVMGGAEAFAAGSYAGPTTVAGQWDNLVSGAKNLVGAGAPQGAEAFPVPGTELGTPLNVSPTTVDGTIPTSFNAPDVGGGYQPAPYTPQQPNVAGLDRYAGVGGGPEIQYGGSAVDPGVATTSTPTTATTTATPDAVDVYGIGRTPKNAFSLSTASPTPPPGGTEKGFFGNLFDKISPSTPSQEVLNQKGFEAVDKLLLQRPDATIGQQNLVFNNAVKAASPSILRQYGPLALGGLGVMSLAGGFKQPESEQPNITGGVTGQQLLEQDPARYGVKFGGVNTTYATPPAYYNPRNYQSQTPPAYAGVQPIQPIQRLAEGGPASMDGYPRKQGAINGPGTGTSDSIKALLSDGEFVFTAKAVRGAGQGSRRKGAKRMYQLMRSLEGKA